MMSDQAPRETRLEETKRVARVLRIVQLINGQPRVWTRRRLAREVEFELRRTSGSHFHYTAPNGTLITFPLGRTGVAEIIIRKEMEAGGIDWETFRKEY